MTELHFAAYCQNLSKVKEYVESGYDVNQKDETGYTPLAWCIDMAATGAIGAAESIIDYLFERGAKLEFRDARYSNIVAFADDCDDGIARHIERLLKR